MRVSSSASALLRAGISAVAVWVLSQPVWAGEAEEGQAAVWAPRELRFVYQGFTTRFSCEGLRDKVRDVLLRLGARKDDLKVYQGACAGRIGAPDPFPSVTIKMQVLTPATPGQAEPAVAAHWKDIDVLMHLSALEAAGQCELYEQIKQKILPLFTVRNVDFNSICVPHQLTPGGQRFKAQVLVADPQPTPPG
jgi:hypothetical protein